MSDDEEDYELAPALHKPDTEKIQRKMANLPTKEKLAAEKNPHTITPEDLEMQKKLILDILSKNVDCESELNKVLKQQMKQHKIVHSKSHLLAGYQSLLNDKKIDRSTFLEDYLVSKAPRSQSGVLVVTVFTSAYPEVDGVKQKFSCQWNCYYCPNEPGQPRSYLLNEPGVRRANRLDFDAIAQFYDRVGALVAIGHPADKVELLVLGGTWESYPPKYRENFIRDLFFAANTYFGGEDGRKRARQDLLSEQMMNESAACKIIGLTLETRPDTINTDMLVDLRRLGCTRVQLGVQHTNDSILSLVNREAYREDTVRAIRLLKDSCFKVDIHLMPDLPGSSPDMDKAMFNEVLSDGDLQADQWKIYPTMTTPFTVIKQWYEQGKYQSYGLDALIDVLIDVKRKVHPWIRLNRVIRDIPVEYVLNGIEVSNLRQLLQIRMQKDGKGTCQCIRCREVKGDKEVAAKVKTAVLVERSYDGSRGEEVFLSYETPDRQTIFAFLRLRFPPHTAQTPFPELRGCALIRELHVYGNLKQAQTDSSVPQHLLSARSAAQHSGLGTRLLLRAEQLAALRGFNQLAVISGVGVRNYYRSRGFVLKEAHRGAFQFKKVENFLHENKFIQQQLLQVESDVARAKLKPEKMIHIPGTQLQIPFSKFLLFTECAALIALFWFVISSS